MGRNGRSLVFALLGMTTFCTQAACVVLAPPEGAPLARVPIDDRDPTFRVTYTHSVTRTPVDEVYRIDGARLVETEIRFVQHGPGLPTEPGPGERWTTRDGVFELAMRRPLESVVIRIAGEQSPKLDVDGKVLDLARFGNRPMVLDASYTEMCARDTVQ